MSNILPDSFGLLVNSQKRTQYLDAFSQGHDRFAQQFQHPIKDIHVACKYLSTSFNRCYQKMYMISRFTLKYWFQVLPLRRLKG